MHFPKVMFKQDQTIQPGVKAETIVINSNAEYNKAEGDGYVIAPWLCREVLTTPAKPVEKVAEKPKRKRRTKAEMDESRGK